MRTWIAERCWLASIEKPKPRNTGHNFRFPASNNVRASLKSGQMCVLLLVSGCSTPDFQQIGVNTPKRIDPTLSGASPNLANSGVIASLRIPVFGLKTPSRKRNLASLRANPSAGTRSPSGFSTFQPGAGQQLFPPISSLPSLPARWGHLAERANPAFDTLRH